MADDFTNLAPQSNREWLQHINGKIDTLLESQSEDRDIMARFIEKTDAWIACHDKEYIGQQKQVAALDVKVNELDKKIGSTKVVEYVTMIVAAVAAFFGLGK